MAGIDQHRHLVPGFVEQIAVVVHIFENARIMLGLRAVVDAQGLRDAQIMNAFL